MKKIVVMIILFISVGMISGIKVNKKNDDKSYVNEMSENIKVDSGYVKLLSYMSNNKIDFDLTKEEYEELYYEKNYTTYSELNDIIKAEVEGEQREEYSYKDQVQTLSTKGGDNWYDIIDNKLKERPNYSTCKLKSIVSVGDIIYEAKGGFRITGHIAIVSGIKKSSNDMGDYIELIEAVASGVVRSVLDCNRFKEKDGTLLRVKTNQTKRNNAVSFAESQLSKKYARPWEMASKACSNNTSRWVCSQLVWCGYKKQGVDIEYRSRWGFRGEPGVTPRDIKGDNDTYEIYF